MADINQYLEQLRNFDVNDIDWDRIGVWPAPARIFVGIFACALIIFGGYYFFVKERNFTLEQEKAREVTLKKSFEEKAFEAANLEAYRKQMVEMEESFGALIKQLPTDTEVPELLDDISEKGQESRLDIDSIVPEPERATEYYVELPIKVVVAGGYHEFGAFVSGVAGMPRIVTLHDFSIVEKNKDTGSLTMEILAKTYRYKSQED